MVKFGVSRDKVHKKTQTGIFETKGVNKPVRFDHYSKDFHVISTTYLVSIAVLPSKTKGGQTGLYTVKTAPMQNCLKAPELTLKGSVPEFGALWGLRRAIKPNQSS